MSTVKNDVVIPYFYCCTFVQLNCFRSSSKIKFDKCHGYIVKRKETSIFGKVARGKPRSQISFIMSHLPKACRWSQAFWDNVLWPHESEEEHCKRHGSCYSWSKVNTTFHNESIIPTVRRGGVMELGTVYSLKLVMVLLSVRKFWWGSMINRKETINLSRRVQLWNARSGLITVLTSAPFRCRSWSR